MCVGLTIIYAVSGVAVNHVDHWNPDYSIHTFETKTRPLSENDSYSEDTVTRVLKDLNITGVYQNSYIPDPETLKIFLEEGSVSINVKTGDATSEILKKRFDNVTCIAVEPAAHRNLSGGPLGGHHIEGIGIGFIPSIMRMDLVDDIVAVSDEDAMETTRALAREEGIFSGISSGANVFASMQIAKKLGKRHRVVTVIVDTGLKYLRQGFFH